MIAWIAARARFRTGRLEAVGRRLERCRFDRFHLDADLVEQIGEVRVFEQHADRADQRGLLGDDVVARDGSDVGTGSSHAVDHDRDRLLGPHAAERVVQLLGAGGGAARRIDVQDHRLHRRGRGEPVELAHPLLVVANEPSDGHARDVWPGDDAAPAHRGRRGADCEHDHRDGDDAPKGQFAPHATAVDDQVGIKRHQRGPFLDAASCSVIPGPSEAAIRNDASHSSSGSFSFSSPFRRSAVPRMSPKVAPESEEPY